MHAKRLWRARGDSNQFLACFARATTSPRIFSPPPYHQQEKGTGLRQVTCSGRRAAADDERLCIRKDPPAIVNPTKTALLSLREAFLPTQHEQATSSSPPSRTARLYYVGGRLCQPLTGARDDSICRSHVPTSDADLIIFKILLGERWAASATVAAQRSGRETSNGWASGSNCYTA